MLYFARICAHARSWRELAKCRFAHFPSFFSVHVDTYAGCRTIQLNETGLRPHVSTILQRKQQLSMVSPTMNAISNENTRISCYYAAHTVVKTAILNYLLPAS